MNEIEIQKKLVGKRLERWFHRLGSDDPKWWAKEIAEYLINGDPLLDEPPLYRGGVVEPSPAEVGVAAQAMADHCVGELRRVLSGQPEVLAELAFAALAAVRGVRSP